MIRIEISNLDRVIAKVLQMTGNFDGAEEEIVSRWTELLDGTVKPQCPVDTGYMLSCIHAELQGGELKGFFYGIRDADCEYAKFVEFAWGGRNEWFHPAIESGNIIQQMSQIYREVLMGRMGL